MTYARKPLHKGTRNIMPCDVGFAFKDFVEEREPPFYVTINHIIWHIVKMTNVVNGVPTIPPQPAADILFNHIEEILSPKGPHLRLTKMHIGAQDYHDETKRLVIPVTEDFWGIYRRIAEVRLSSFQALALASLQAMSVEEASLSVAGIAAQRAIGYSILPEGMTCPLAGLYTERLTELAYGNNAMTRSRYESVAQQPLNALLQREDQLRITTTGMSTKMKQNKKVP